MVECGGWMMPLQYSSMREEPIAVRERVGLFDVSHMGEFRLHGPGAVEALEGVVTNRVEDLAIGQARYNVVCESSGGIIDDTLVYRHSQDHFTVVVNAGPRLRDLEHFRILIGDACEVEDVTLATGLIAVQGPRALALLSRLVEYGLDLRCRVEVRGNLRAGDDVEGGEMRSRGQAGEHRRADPAARHR